MFRRSVATESTGQRLATAWASLDLPCQCLARREPIWHEKMEGRACLVYGKFVNILSACHRHFTDTVLLGWCGLFKIRNDQWITHVNTINPNGKFHQNSSSAVGDGKQHRRKQWLTDGKLNQKMPEAFLLWVAKAAQLAAGFCPSGCSCVGESQDSWGLVTNIQCPIFQAATVTPIHPLDMSVAVSPARGGKKYHLNSAHLGSWAS